MPVARLGRPHGIDGGVTAVSMSDDPARFRIGARFQIEDQTVTLRHVQERGDGGLILFFAEVADRAEAETLRDQLLTISENERRALPQGEYWPDQLEGLAVVTPDGQRLGHIRAVVPGSAQDRLVVELLDGRVVDIPFVEELVPEVSVSEGRAQVVPIEGLLG